MNKWNEGLDDGQVVMRIGLLFYAGSLLYVTGYFVFTSHFTPRGYESEGAEQRWQTLGLLVGMAGVGLLIASLAMRRAWTKARSAPNQTSSSMVHDAVRRLVVVASAILFVAMGLYPPWICTEFLRPGLQIQNPFKYGLLTDPPAGYGSAPFGCAVSLDTSRLLVQWFVLAVVTLALIHLVKERRKE